jgi:hypothetical protein
MKKKKYERSAEWQAADLAAEAEVKQWEKFFGGPMLYYGGFRRAFLAGVQWQKERVEKQAEMTKMVGEGTCQTGTGK